LAPGEKRYRLAQLANELRNGLVDAEMVNWVKKFNEIEWLCTTQCCCGHGKNDGRRAHIDFRSERPVSAMVNMIRKAGWTSLELALEENSLQYRVWLGHCRTPLVDVPRMLQKLYDTLRAHP